MTGEFREASKKIKELSIIKKRRVKGKVIIILIIMAYILGGLVMYSYLRTGGFCS